MDILFKNDDFVFSYRVGGILTHNGKILLQRPKNDDYAIIGGHVVAMETSMETLKREFEEEIHAKIEVDNLLAIGEIYFPWGKRPCHQICLYYNVHLVDDGIPLDGVFHGYDELDNERIDLDFCWVPLEPSAEELNFIRILYSTLLKNEVSEKYVNQILDEVEQFIRPGNSVDMILANVYQKLILRFGQPKPIELSGAKPKVLAFVGPTGVGKTTTIAKIASKYKVDYNKKVAFITLDTYRIAATEQLQVYANILDAPMTIVYSKDEINSAIEKYADYDLVFVDTAGFSHKNTPQRDDMKKLLDEIDTKYSKEVYLVLSATTKYKDLLEIVDIYHEITDYKFIFTKLDETTTYGNLLNIKLYAGAELSYMTIGQNVPDDIAIFDTQKIVKQLLGGNA